jgi:hypothetical protein
MPFDPWEHLWFTNNWIMNSFPPIEDYHHFYLQTEKEKEYQADLAFYGNKNYDNDLYFNNIENDRYDQYDQYDQYDDHHNKYESSSDSDYEEFEYI